LGRKKSFAKKGKKKKKLNRWKCPQRDSRGILLPSPKWERGASRSSWKSVRGQKGDQPRGKTRRMNRGDGRGVEEGLIKSERIGKRSGKGTVKEGAKGNH